MDFFIRIYSVNVGNFHLLVLIFRLHRKFLRIQIYATYKDKYVDNRFRKRTHHSVQYFDFLNFSGISKFIVSVIWNKLYVYQKHNIYWMNRRNQWKIVPNIKQFLSGKGETCQFDPLYINFFFVFKIIFFSFEREETCHNKDINWRRILYSRRILQQ